MQKKINLIYIVIIIIELFLLKMYTDKKEEENVRKVERNSINYVLNQGNLYNTTNDNESIITYNMILEIPEINLKKGILEKSNQDNNIEKNVTILENSSYPDKEGNIILAAHSGNGNKSYFNELINLKINDEAFLYYKNIKYIYSLIEIREINKNNQISLQLNNKNNLILITCSQKNKTKYLVFIFNQKAEI